METQLKKFQRGTITSNWTRDHSCDIMADFCTCPKNILEAKLKSFRLLLLAEKISRQPNIGSTPRLLVITLMQVYNDKKQKGQKGIQNIQFEEKKGIGKFNVGAVSCAEREKEGWNKGSGTLRVRPHQDNPAFRSRKSFRPLVKGRGLKGFLLLKSINKSKIMKCNSQRGPDSIPSRQQNLAASVVRFLAFES